MTGFTGTIALTTLDEISPEEWQALAQRRVFFGHQSVGRNIMDGVRSIVAERPELGLNLVEATDLSQVRGPAFMDANIGANRSPATKSEAFARLVANGLGDGAIAMYKFCYVDIDGDTDVEALFAAYRKQMRQMVRLHAGVTLVHITLPLKVAPEGMKEMLKTRLGRPTQTSLNIKRNRFNELMRAEFGGKSPLFDLARLEATRPDGSRAFVRYRSEPVEMLAPEWTSDGGHLNEAARRYVAEHFLVLLARLAAAPVSAPGQAN